MRVGNFFGGRQKFSLKFHKRQIVSLVNFFDGKYSLKFHKRQVGLAGGIVFVKSVRLANWVNVFGGKNLV